MAEVEAAPKIIKEGVSIEEAEALKAKFEELGAAITLKWSKICTAGQENLADGILMQ